MPYRLTRVAEADIVEIAEQGIRRWGNRQARVYHDGLFKLFELIASTPAMARQRTELTPPVRVQRYKAHLVIYLIDEEGVLIVRVRHGREDWQEDL
ncbi:MAG: type II toxin-antitoxin system RelE/ParE family toxin [Rhizobium sp.]|nr:type II toxin-antitoxin system RelE/ParE family toxin [Rhizobium sp.]MCZ8351547.1 type II toxin-antitoxin system RelE/ParE family toxin [Rhizobium sp.]